MVVANSPAELLAGLNKIASNEFTDIHGHDDAVRSTLLPKQSSSAISESHQALWTAVLADGLAPCAAHEKERLAAARRFGQLLADDGATVGLGCTPMQGTIAGALVAGTLESGGSVASILEARPHMASDSAVATDGTDTTDSEDVKHLRQDRKRRLLEGSNRIVALPGGVAVWEELLEAFSGAQLERHSLPMGILNTNGFYDPFLRQLESTVDCGFLQRECLSYLVSGATPDELLENLRHYSPTRVVKLGGKHQKVDSKG